ncbi:hypothetical protein CYMTET_28782 [Cymbomonas tetramitiformis]|uniref:Uncharacterized protein n=1 Tax=Cymbomonas tetramitiformis TaxID=36881 RepID=A0AAE0FM53_9CHLO|nr:hypothetical protein CYMTET_28782 [Cymbomonas tetramitiformis]
MASLGLPLTRPRNTISSDSRNIFVIFSLSVENGQTDVDGLMRSVRESLDDVCQHGANSQEGTKRLPTCVAFCFLAPPIDLARVLSQRTRGGVHGWMPVAEALEVSGTLTAQLYDQHLTQDQAVEKANNENSATLNADGTLEHTHMETSSHQLAQRGAKLLSAVPHDSPLDIVWASNCSPNMSTPTPDVLLAYSMLKTARARHGGLLKLCITTPPRCAPGFQQLADALGGHIFAPRKRVSEKCKGHNRSLVGDPASEPSQAHTSEAHPLLDVALCWRGTLSICSADERLLPSSASSAPQGRPPTARAAAAAPPEMLLQGLALSLLPQVALAAAGAARAGSGVGQSERRPQQELDAAACVASGAFLDRDAPKDRGKEVEEPSTRPASCLQVLEAVPLDMFPHSLLHGGVLYRLHTEPGTGATSEQLRATSSFLASWAAGSSSAALPRVALVARLTRHPASGTADSTLDEEGPALLLFPAGSSIHACPIASRAESQGLARFCAPEPLVPGSKRKRVLADADKETLMRHLAALPTFSQASSGSPLRAPAAPQLEGHGDLRALQQQAVALAWQGAGSPASDEPQPGTSGGAQTCMEKEMDRWLAWSSKGGARGRTLYTTTEMRLLNAMRHREQHAFKANPLALDVFGADVPPAKRRVKKHTAYELAELEKAVRVDKRCRGAGLVQKRAGAGADAGPVAQYISSRRLGCE